ncbi:hypothetical protein HK102_011467, partial [Quaeritorhiza haematococci]
MTRKVIVRALYDYSGREESSLSFKTGDIIQVLNQLESGWWDGVCRGERGWFPSNYVSAPEVTIEGVGQAGNDVQPTQQPLQQQQQWIRQTTPSGTFYYNPLTQETTWDIPPNYDPSLDPSSPSSSTSLQNASQQQQQQQQSNMSDSGDLRSPDVRSPGGASMYGAMSPTSIADIGGGGMSGFGGGGGGMMAGALPENWTVFEAEDGSLMYYNSLTKERRWNPPEGSTPPSTLGSPSGGALASGAVMKSGRSGS